MIKTGKDQDTDNEQTDSHPDYFNQPEQSTAKICDNELHPDVAALALTISNAYEGEKHHNLLNPIDITKNWGVKYLTTYNLNNSE